MPDCPTCGAAIPPGAQACACCDAAATAPAIGTALDDRYEVVRTLGRGGMGVVVLARDRERDGAPVALKMLPEALDADPDALVLLRREASVAMRLSHPNVVRLHNLEGRTRKYVVMELVEGGSLADLLAARLKGEFARPAGWTGPGLAPEEVAPLLDGIAAGLDHAHGERILHRDMKPANVLLARRGDTVVPKVADFGIAAEIRGLVSRVTQQRIAGTPAYMSPEHYRGEKLDARADLYSLGATVYHLMAGRPPFPGGDLSYQILNTPPAPIDGVPAGVMAVVAQAMAKEPGSRHTTCTAFARAFREAVATAGLAEQDLATMAPHVATRAPPLPPWPAPETPPRALAPPPGVPPPGAAAAGPVPVGADGRGRSSRAPLAACALAVLAGAGLAAAIATRRDPTRAATATPASTPAPSASISVAFLESREGKAHLESLMESRRLEETIRLLDMVPRPDDDHLFIRAAVAYLFAARGALPEAEAAWKLLLELRPAETPNALAETAKKLARDGRHDAARRALALAKRHGASPELLDAVRRLLDGRTPGATPR
jgi:serine/threonine-protein kinase